MTFKNQFGIAKNIWRNKNQELNGSRSGKKK